MRIHAHSSPTAIGPATILTLANARSASPAEVFEYFSAAMVLPSAGIIIHGQCPQEAVGAIAYACACAVQGIPWVARQQFKLGHQAVVIAPEEQAGKLVKYRPQASELCPSCGGNRTIRYGSSRGKQRWMCKGCDRTWVAA